MLMQHSTNGNLFDTHPAKGGAIFQIDGNFGATAAIAEMLLQSHDGSIDLLPALPQAWPEGNVRGLKARGNVTVNLAWKAGRATECSLQAAQARPYAVRAPKGQRITGATSNGRKVALNQLEAGLVSFELTAGQMCQLSIS